MTKYSLVCGIETQPDDVSNAAEYAHHCEGCDQDDPSVRRRSEWPGMPAWCDDCAMVAAVRVV